MADTPAPALPAVPDFSKDIGGYIGKFILLRAKIKQIENRHKEELAPLKAMLQMMENGFLAALQKSGADNAAKKGVGCVYLKTKRSATIADADAFRRFVIGGGHYDLVDWKANGPAIAEFIETDGAGVPPPGVNFSTMQEVSIRKA